MRSEWKDKKADEMTLEEARQAVKDLREIVADRLEPVNKSAEEKEPQNTISDYYKEAPPLGIKPAWLFYEPRIKELGEAISRYAEINNHNNHIISKLNKILTSVKK